MKKVFRRWYTWLLSVMSQAADVRLASAILVMREKGFVEGKHGQLARPVLRMRTKVFLDGKPGRLV